MSVVSGCRREDDDRPARCKCGGERISLRQLRLAALGLPWLCERARQHRLKSLGNKQDSSRCVVCGVGDGWGDGVFNSDEKVRVRERVRKRRKRLA